jgi:2'-5' RNA ligase
MTRLFVALWPPDEVREELRQLHRKDQRGVRFVPEDNWHVTLRFLGEADVDEVAAALDTVRFEPAVARLGPAVDVLHERALVVPVGGSDELAAAVAEAMHNIGEPARKRFHGHLTVARVKPNVPMPRVLGATVHAEWAVAEVALVQSRLDPAGARYTTLATWPVPPPGATPRLRPGLRPGPGARAGSP